MSRLEIQISIAAVFLTVLVCATEPSAPDPNPTCNPSKCKANSVCINTKDHLGNGLDVCFDKPTPSGKNGNVFQAYLVRCYEETSEKECSECCKAATGIKSYGNVINDFCLCKLLN